MKRQQVLASVTHLVEIDLLRGGKPLPIVGEMPSADYRISILRGDRRPLADLYTFTIGNVSHDSSNEELESVPHRVNLSELLAKVGSLEYTKLL